MSNDAKAKDIARIKAQKQKLGIKIAQAYKGNAVNFSDVKDLDLKDFEEIIADSPLDLSAEFIQKTSLKFLLAKNG